MSAYGTLTRLMLRNRLSAMRPSSWRSADGRIEGKRVFSMLMLALLVLIVVGTMGLISFGLFYALESVGRMWLLPALALVVNMVGMLLLSLYYVLGSLYLGKDTVWLAYLPAKSGTVMLAKLTEIYLGEMLLGAGVLLPGAIMCGISAGMGVAYWVRLAVVTLLVPVIPLSILTLLATLLAGSTAISRHREGLTMVMSLLFFVLVMMGQLALQCAIPDEAGAEFFAQILLDKEALIDRMTGYFPPVQWALRGLRGDWAQLGLFALTCLGAATFCRAAIGPRYLNIALRQQETGKRRKAVHMDAGSYRGRSQLSALVHLEWLELKRTSVYVVNGLSGVISMPLVLGILYFTGSNGGEVDMRQLIGSLKNGMGLSAMDFILLMMAVCSLAAWVNVVAASSVSRERSRFAFGRTLPVQPAVRMCAKLIVSQGVTLVGSVLTGVMAALLTGIGAWQTLLGILLSQLPALALTMTALAIDANHPRLHYANETQTMKNNTNVAIAMLVNTVQLLVIGAAVIPAWNHGALTRMLAVIGASGVMLVISFICYRRSINAYAAFEDSEG